MRHAETLFNLQGRTQGWCDSPLTKRGIEQAKLTGLELARRGLTFDHAYCSTSERCSDTLELTCEAAFGKPMPYERLKGLKELNFGAYEAQPQALEAHGDDFSRFYVPFGGEDHNEAAQRLTDTLSDLLERPQHEQILVCSHGGIAINFYMKWKDYALVEPTLFSNCMIYVYDYEPREVPHTGTFSCIEMFVADLSSLERPDMPTQVRRMGPPELSVHQNDD